MLLLMHCDQLELTEWNNKFWNFGFQSVLIMISFDLVKFKIIELNCI